MNIYFKKINFPALLIFVNERLFLWEPVFSYFPKNCKKVPCNLNLHRQHVRCCPRNIPMFRRRLVQCWKERGGMQNDHSCLPFCLRSAAVLPQVTSSERVAAVLLAVVVGASYFSASFQITWRIIGFLILQGVWRNGPKAQMSRWVLQSLFPPPQVLRNLPAVMGTGLSCPAGTAPEVPHYSAVSNGRSIKFSENYFGSLSGWNCVHKITTLLLLIVYENNCVGVWSTGCALCKAVVTRVCSLGSVLFLLGTPSVSLCLHRIVKQQEPLALKITCLFASVLRQFLVIFHHLTWRRSPL